MPLFVGTRAALLGGNAGAVISASGALDGVASLTAAWSLSRNLRSSFAGTRYSDTGGAIDSITDQNGDTGRNLGATLTARPTLATAGPNSLACADLDGSNDFMATTDALSDFITNSSGAAVVAAIIDGVSLNSANVYQNHGIIGDSGVFMGLVAKNVSGTTPTFLPYNWDGEPDPDASDHSAGITFSTGTPYVLMWRHQGGSLLFSVNGGVETSLASGNTSTMTGTFRLGVLGASTNCNMKFFEGFTTSDGSQTAALAAAIADMKTWIGA